MDVDSSTAYCSPSMLLMLEVDKSIGEVINYVDVGDWSYMGLQHMCNIVLGCQ